MIRGGPNLERFEPDRDGDCVDDKKGFGSTRVSESDSASCFGHGDTRIVVHVLAFSWVGD